MILQGHDWSKRTPTANMTLLQVKEVEDVVYDLSLRNLVPKSGEAWHHVSRDLVGWNGRAELSRQIWTVQKLTKMSQRRPKMKSDRLHYVIVFYVPHIKRRTYSWNFIFFSKDLLRENACSSTFCNIEDTPSCTLHDELHYNSYKASKGSASCLDHWHTQ